MTASAPLIRRRAADLRRRVDAVAERTNRDPATIRIVAVTKSWPLEVCRAAVEAGFSMLGENRVQEAEPKIAALPAAEWHLVGRLQSNKARRAAAAFAAIHAVDTLTLLRRLDAVAHDDGSAPRLLLEVNTTAEPQKGGFAPAALASPGLAAALRELRVARVVGLMTIARAGADPRPAFAALGRARDALQQRLGAPLPELSMGMSGDWEAAVAEGATLLRIGTALFGPRAG